MSDDKISMTALEDLDSTSFIYKAAAFNDGKLANTGAEASGLLTATAKNGEHVPLLYTGRGKFVAGAAVTAGARLTVVTSGFLVIATSGSWIVGRNIDAAVASGETAEGIFDFTGPSYMVSSL